VKSAPLPPSQIAKQLGACIRLLRQDTGLSQVEFGEKCGFYQTYLSRVENGYANPTINALEVIANALGLTVFELFDRVREQVPPKKPRRR
jgi:transcriptional regulator with XRE-family HTH domain